MIKLYLKLSLKYLFIIFILPTYLGFTAVKSTTGNIHFDVNKDGTVEATLNPNGLGIGTTPSANLHVSGNAIISNQLMIGNNTSGVSSLEIGGSIAFSSITYAAGSNTLGNSSFFIVDTSLGNVSLSLPSASSYTGRIIQIKRTNTNNSLYLSGAGNLMDSYTTLQFLSGNLTHIKFLSNGTKWFVMDTSRDETLQEVGNQNLYLWWKLDETSGNVAASGDSSSHSGNLTNSHSFSGNSFTGVLQNALLLDDKNDTITHNGSSLSSTGYSYSLWIKSNKTPDSTIDHDPVISGPAGFCWTSSNTFYKQSAYHKLSNGNYVSSKINSTLSANTWYHIAVSWDGSNIKTYLNGSYESGNTASSWTGAANIIASQSGSYNSGNVLLDDIRYFNQALDNEAIYSLYRAGQ